MMHHRPGGYLGAIAILTATPYRASTRALADSRLFLVEPDAFRKLAVEAPTVLTAVLGVFSPVMESIQGLVREREKLVALGGLAAGLAHELNNPAAAARRSVAQVRRMDEMRQAALAELIESKTGPEELGRLLELTAEAMGDTSEAGPLDPLAASDLEDALASWLEEHDVADVAALASPLVEAGVDQAWLERLSDALGSASLDAGLRWAVPCITIHGVIGELETATGRVSELVGAVKEYSFMDQAPRQAVDVHAGLESTLTILSHKLNQGKVVVARDYDPELPRIDAFGSQLNQVWTNLIDNAIDAVDGQGQIRLRTARAGDRILVEVADDGPGIPEEIQRRIFEPFFTTKDVGRGTGLGLDIVQRIVLQHHGELRVESRPGDTRFQVLLPLE